jgi:hypothetical protein
MTVVENVVVFDRKVGHRIACLDRHSAKVVGVCVNPKDRCEFISYSYDHSMIVYVHLYNVERDSWRLQERASKVEVKATPTVRTPTTMKRARLKESSSDDDADTVFHLMCG